MTIRRRSYLTERVEILDDQLVERFRKEFLMLMKNVKPMLADGNLEKIDYWRNAVLKWGTEFEEMMSQIREKINQKLRSQSALPDYKKTVNEDDAKYLLKTMKDVWRFSGDMRTLPGGSLSYYRMPGNEWYTDVRILDRARGELPKWERTVRRTSLAAWKWLKDVSEWTKRTGVNSGGGEISINQRETENIVIDGLKVQILGFMGSDFEKEGMNRFTAGLREFKKCASRVFPQLLKNMRPIVLNFDDRENSNAAATYTPEYIKVGFWGMHMDKRNVASVIAHEMGHHVWNLLSDKAQKAWGDFIHGSTTILDLRDVVKKGMDVDSEMALKDPILFTQLRTLYYDPAYSSLQLFGLKSIQKYLDNGGDSKFVVTNRPVSGYSARNPSEAFCEVISLLVVYGKNTVLPEIVNFVKMLVSGLKTEGIESIRDMASVLLEVKKTRNQENPLRGEKYAFKNWDEPWKIMSPEDRKEAHRLFVKIMKSYPRSQYQRDAQAKLDELLIKYGLPTAKR